MLRCAVLPFTVSLFAATLLPLVSAAGDADMQTTDAIPPAAFSELRGVIRAPGRIDIATDLVARVSAVGFQAGETFARDQQLMRFDCGGYVAALKEAEATHRAAAVMLRQKTHLRKLGAAGKGEVETAAAEAARSAASVQLAGVRMKDCSIKAPFDGRVVEVHVSAHEMPEPGQPLITIIDDSRLEIEMIVPSTALRTLKPGARFAFRVDETGGTVQAAVDRIGAEVDPVSQTVKIMARLQERPQNVLAGMSGSAELDEAAR